jgi:hypothetical protein
MCVSLRCHCAVIALLGQLRNDSESEVRMVAPSVPAFAYRRKE